MKRRLLNRTSIKRLSGMGLALAMAFASMTGLTVNAAEASDDYITDSNGIMEYSDGSRFFGYDVKGYVNDEWQQVTLGNLGIYAGAYKGGDSLTITPKPGFVADGRAIELEYTVKNTGSTAVSDYRFFVYADTAIMGNDDSKNEISDNAIIMTEEDVSFFAFSATEGGTPVIGDFDDLKYVLPIAIMDGGDQDPSTIPSDTSEGIDSAFLIYFPTETLAAGEEKTYSLVFGMGEASEIAGIIKQVKADTTDTTPTVTAVPYANVATTSGSVRNITQDASVNTGKSSFNTNIQNTETYLQSALGITDAQKSNGVNVWLSASDISSTVSDTEKQAVSNVVASKYAKGQVGMYLNVDLFMKETDKDTERITETSKPITISFTVPDSLIDATGTLGRQYHLVRIHNGETQVIDGTFDASAKTLTFESDKFSTYALVYEDTAATATTSTATATTSTATATTSTATATTSTASPKTGETDTLWVMLAMAAGLVLVSTYVYRKKAR